MFFKTIIEKRLLIRYLGKLSIKIRLGTIDPCNHRKSQGKVPNLTEANRQAAVSLIQ